jgi:hypothetical protein
MTAGDCLWLKETTRGTYETIEAAVMYKFGIEPPDNAFPLQMPNSVQINSVSNMGSRNATFTKGTSFPENIKAMYGSVNGLEEFRMLGDSSTADSVHTLTAAAVNVAKPSLTLFRQAYSATEKRKAAGAVSKALSLQYKPGAPLMVQETFDAMTDAISTDSPSASPVFPTNIASAFDVPSTFTINAASYTYERITWNWNHNIEGYGNNAGKRRGIIDTTPIILTCAVDIVGDATALRTIIDGAQTGVTVVWKLLKSVDTAKYKQYSCSMFLGDVSENYRQDDGTDRCVVTMLGSNPTVTVKDGVADAFYGD